MQAGEGEEVERRRTAERAKVLGQTLGAETITVQLGQAVRCWSRTCAFNECCAGRVLGMLAMGRGEEEEEDGGDWEGVGEERSKRRVSWRGQAGSKGAKGGGEEATKAAGWWFVAVVVVVVSLSDHEPPLRTPIAAWPYCCCCCCCCCTLEMRVAPGHRNQNDDGRGCPPSLDSAAQSDHHPSRRLI